jgi:phosphatidylglycerol:prolipoprotein diacylglycerol transferase
MVAVGFLVGLWWTVRASGRKGINSAVVVDAALYILLAGVIGARIVYVTHEWSYYRENLAEIPKIWDAGLSFYGALAASAVVGYVYAKRKAIGFARFADLLAPSVAVGYAFARIGCFLNGCCSGIPTALPWGVRFHDPFNPSIVTPPSHPAQLYSSAVSLAIFAILVWIDRKGYRDGTVFATYLALYGGTRFLIEFLRAGQRIAIGPVHLTLAQLASLPLFAGAGLAVVLLNSRGRK